MCVSLKKFNDLIDDILNMSPIGLKSCFYDRLSFRIFFFLNMKVSELFIISEMKIISKLNIIALRKFCNHFSKSFTLQLSFVSAERLNFHFRSFH